MLKKLSTILVCIVMISTLTACAEKTGDIQASKVRMISYNGLLRDNNARIEDINKILSEGWQLAAVHGETYYFVRR